MKAFVLAYHSHNIFGSEYATNDHVALASDLATITDAGAKIVPLAKIVEIACAGKPFVETLVGLTFDDGPVFDVAGMRHAAFGPQAGFLDILREFQARRGVRAQPNLHATSFVIASPEARAAMERAPSCGFADHGHWLDDSWWNEAIDTGLLGIGNHSWDHVHSEVPHVALSRDIRNDFTQVDNHADADRQIRQASDYILAKTSGRCDYFAFPFGHVNDYLRRDYLPNRIAEHRMLAAFSTEPRPVVTGDDRWSLPRFVHGHHWKSPEELASMLRG